MREKLARFIRSHLGHVVLAFVLYCVFIFVILFSLKVFIPERGVNSFATGTTVSLGTSNPTDSINKGYSRPVKLAIVMTEMGLSKERTAKAIKSLPGGISFAFSPYSKKLDYWFSESRKFNHELLLTIPMEPINYPNNDSGPLSLLTRYSGARNIEILKNIMRKANGYDGVVTWMGGEFMTSPKHLRPVFEYLQGTDLFFLDTVDYIKNQSNNKKTAEIAKEVSLPYLQTHIVLDDVATRDNIFAQLEALESLARLGSGYAVAIAHSYPVTIDVLKEWEKTLEKKNISLVPVTIIAKASMK